ncbi:hypothetical protein L0Z64_19340 (plasmid) [Phaeobacter sp. BS23]|uniref:hypothetical protein n=1 Tax=Phaeobacter sp. BS23 TaxID=2907239 RepID=UPI003703B77F
MTPVDAPGNSREPVLALTDIVLATGPVGEEKLILRGLDLRLEEDQTVCIVFDNVDQAEALANVISGRQVVTHGRIYRAHGDPVSVIWANDDKIKETPPAGIVLSAVPPRDRSVFSKVFVLEAGLAACVGGCRLGDGHA